MNVTELAKKLVKLEAEGKGDYEVIIDAFYYGGEGYQSVYDITVINSDKEVELEIRKY